jgi:hypothetical protein
MSNTSTLLNTDLATERETRPDFGLLVREALAFHGAITFDHLIRCLPLWRPAIWFPKHWPDRVRRALQRDPHIEEVDGLWQLRAAKTRSGLPGRP